MLRDLGFTNQWRCYDIAPLNDEDSNASSVFVEQRDTLADFPKDAAIVITNPPYLAKNSATMRRLSYAGAEFDDVYKHAVDVMLKNSPYVAAIIPESFITQKLFHTRLSSVVSLTCRMFEDTEAPVCLALFVPEKAKKKLDRLFNMGRK